MLHVSLSREEEDKRISLNYKTWVRFPRLRSLSIHWELHHARGWQGFLTLTAIPCSTGVRLPLFSRREGRVHCSRLGTTVSCLLGYTHLEPWPAHDLFNSQRASVCPQRGLLDRMTWKLSVIAAQTGAVSGTEACHGCVKTGSVRLLLAVKTSSRANHRINDSLAQVSLWQPSSYFVRPLCPRGIILLCSHVPWIPARFAVLRLWTTQSLQPSETVHL